VSKRGDGVELPQLSKEYIIIYVFYIHSQSK